jgi:hypothetical protein
MCRVCKCYRYALYLAIVVHHFPVDSKVRSPRDNQRQHKHNTRGKFVCHPIVWIHVLHPRANSNRRCHQDGVRVNEQRKINYEYCNPTEYNQPNDVIYSEVAAVRLM